METAELAVDTVADNPELVEELAFAMPSNAANATEAMLAATVTTPVAMVELELELHSVELEVVEEIVLAAIVMLSNEVNALAEIHAALSMNSNLSLLLNKGMKSMTIDINQ